MASVTTRERQDILTKKHEKLLSKCKTFKPSDQNYIDLLFKDIAIRILQENEIGSEAGKDEMTMDIMASLPPSEEVYSNHYFKKPVYGMLLLKKVADLYNVLEIPDETFSSLDGHTKNDSVAMIHVWLASTFSHPPSQVAHILAAYRESRKISFTTPPTQLQGSTSYVPTPVPVYQSDPPAEPNNSPTSAMTPAITSQHPTLAVDSVVSPVLPSNANQPALTTGDRSQPHSSSGTLAQKITGICTYFRHRAFTGTRGERSIRTVIRDFNVASRMYALTDADKTKFFINAFESPARDWFFENATNSMNYEELCKMVVEHYDSDARQLSVQAQLETMTLDSFMLQNEITDLTTGLDKIVEHIEILTPQCPFAFRNEPNKLRFLRSAVKNQSWALQSIGQITAAKYSFNDFVTALHEGLTLAVETGTHSGTLRNTPLLQHQLGRTLYQQYGRMPPAPYKNGPRPPRPPIQRNPSDKNPLDRNGVRLRCYACGADDHFMGSIKCKRRNSARDQVKSHLRQGVPAVHIVEEILRNFEAENLDQTPSEQQSSDSVEVRHIDQAAASELDAFEQIEACNQASTDDAVHTDFFEDIDATNAINHIHASMNGTLQDGMSSVNPTADFQ